MQFFKHSKIQFSPLNSDQYRAHLWNISCSCDILIFSFKRTSIFSFNFSSSCWVVSKQYSAVDKMLQQNSVFLQHQKNLDFSKLVPKLHNYQQILDSSWFVYLPTSVCVLNEKSRIRPAALKSRKSLVKLVTLALKEGAMVLSLKLPNT